MQRIEDKRVNVTEQQAVSWIKINNKDINPNEWRAKYYERIGLRVSQSDRNLQRQDQFQNDKYYINFFYQRTPQQIRNRYYSRLMIEDNPNAQMPRKKDQHIFIFDWDDTILCTSYLSSFQFLDIGPEAKAVLQKLDECSFKLVSKSIERGEKVFIITNAAKGWVQYSSKIYLPKINGLLINNSLKIISARSMFGEEFPGDFGRWKIEAFKSILNSIDRNLVTNLICIGDSNVQMEAAHCLSKQFQHSLVKTIKFRQNPKPDELIKQQQLVHQRMKEIFESTKNLTIRLERKSSLRK